MPKNFKTKIEVQATLNEHVTVTREEKKDEQKIKHITVTNTENQPN